MFKFIEEDHNFLDEDAFNEALPRSSTPESGSPLNDPKDEWTYEGMAYEIFLKNIGENRTKFVKRGLKGFHPAIRTCHLVEFSNGKRFEQNSFDLFESGASDTTRRIFSVQRAIRNVFNIVFASKNRCKTKTCPVTCKCRLNDSLLNRRFESEEDEDAESILKSIASNEGGGKKKRLIRNVWN